jgi:hypothetical protein
VSSILIGLHGVKQSGKDTTADFIEKFAAVFDPPLSSMRRGFADKGKLAFMRQFIPDITMEDALKIVDRFKEDHDALISFPSVSIIDESTVSSYITFRNALAQFCTEGGRDVYGPNHWVDQLLPYGWDLVWTQYMRWQMSFLRKLDENTADPADVCLIRDLRFDNELARIQALGGTAIKIRRKDAEQAVIEEAKRQGREVHRSELGLDDSLFDHIINNDDNDLVLAEQRTFDVWERILDACF